MAAPSLLIVEDDPALLGELTEYLGDQGFAVDGATSIQAAECKLQNPFDLLVLDLNLPDGSGVELVGRLRPYVRSGIVICSGRSERELRLSMLRSGADAYLVKPVDPEELAAVLASVARRVRPAAPSPMLAASLPPQVWRLDRTLKTLKGPQGDSVALTAADMLLLLELFNHPDRQADRQHLLDVFEGAGIPMTGPRLETQVSRLRGKVFAACGVQLPLRASYKRGYIFAGYGLVI